MKKKKSKLMKKLSVYSNELPIVANAPITSLIDTPKVVCFDVISHTSEMNSPKVGKSNHVWSIFTDEPNEEFQAGVLSVVEGVCVNVVAHDATNTKAPEAVLT